MSHRKTDQVFHLLENQELISFKPEYSPSHTYEVEGLVHLRTISNSKFNFDIGTVFNSEKMMSSFVTSNFSKLSDIEHFDIRMSLKEIFNYRYKEKSLASSISLLRSIIKSPEEWSDQQNYLLEYEPNHTYKMYFLRFNLADVEFRLTGYPWEEVDSGELYYSFIYPAGAYRLKNSEMINLIYQFAEGFRIHLKYFVPDTIVSDEKLEEYTQALKNFKEKMYDPLVVCGEIVEIEQPKLNL